ncbi:MAG: hypothetical protein IPM39_25000 [Chloroflexi bacterium]|nr:hypothetical protein [Chloroflexota bacterium]
MADTQLKHTIEGAMSITGAYTGVGIVYQGSNGVYNWQYSGNPVGSRPIATIRDGSLSAIASTATPEEAEFIRDISNNAVY